MKEISNNKRIAYNTLILYIKLFVSTIVGILSSRYILLALGVDDFGMYTVIGGIVVIMNFMGTVMNATSYRFITVEIGKKGGNPNRIYNTIQLIHILLAVFLLILGETIGCWYVDNYLNIDPAKLTDARFLLHLSVASSIFSILAVPSNGLLIAMENFKFQAIVEILTSVLKLIFVLFLASFGTYALRAFAIFVLIQSIILPVSNYLYCKRHYCTITKIVLNRNIQDYKDILFFAGWTILGASSTLAQRQGMALIVNFFFSTAVNAAMGLANTISGYIMLFVTNIGRAAVPQIMKNFSAGEESKSFNITFRIAKYSFFMVLFPAVPCLLFIDKVLGLWLGNVPIYTAEFAVFLVLSNIFWCLSVGFDSAIQASGQIKKYQIYFSLINVSCIPMSLLLFKGGLPPYSITIYVMVSNFFLLLTQIKILTRISKFSVKEYIHSVIVPASKVMFCVLILVCLKLIVGDLNIIMVFLFMCLIEVYLFIIIYIMGLDKNERSLISNFINTKLHKLA